MSCILGMGSLSLLFALHAFCLSAAMVSRELHLDVHESSGVWFMVSVFAMGFSLCSGMAFLLFINETRDLIERVRRAEEWADTVLYKVKNAPAKLREIADAMDLVATPPV